MTDQEIINALINKGILVPYVANRLLEDARLAEKPVEDLIYERKLVSEETLLKIKSELLKVPFRRVNPDLVSEDLIRLIPRETCQTYLVVPIEKKDDLLVVGMVRPDDQRALDALKFIAKKNHLSLGIYLITPSDLKAVLRRYMPYQSEIEAALKEISYFAKTEDITNLEEGGSGEEAPIIKIVALLLKQAVEMKASDIHIEPQRDKLRVRFRLHGELKEIISLPRGLIQPVISRVKVLARLKLDETRIPQDGRFRTVIFGRDIDYRVATFPTPLGEKIAIRVLDPETGLKGLDKLGLSDYHQKDLEEAVNRPYGMILISGPTGSGKTTTLYAIMQKLNDETVNIVSLEDPVEYFISGINQSQIRPEIGYDFSSGLRQILRQDPDVIMVGEIRDSETASLAVNAALTGHIVLSTIHTNNAVGVIARLVDLGVPPFLLSSALNLMIAQRLVLELCPDCRVEEEASALISEIIDKSLDNLPEFLKSKYNFKKPYKVFHLGTNENCSTCGGKGFLGRVALFEMFKMTRELGDLISKGFTEGKLIDEAKRQEMVSLRQDGILKALEGRVSIEEVLRETTEIY